MMVELGEFGLDFARATRYCDSFKHQSFNPFQDDNQHQTLDFLCGKCTLGEGLTLGAGLGVRWRIEKQDIEGEKLNCLICNQTLSGMADSGLTLLEKFECDQDQCAQHVWSSENSDSECWKCFECSEEGFTRWEYKYSNEG
jgi:hypothetical protein